MTEADQELAALRTQAGEFFLRTHEEKHELERERRIEQWKGHEQHHTDTEVLQAERWKGHDREHESIAHNLSEYKAQSNEWRGSLSDLRATFASQSATEAFEKEMRAALEQLGKRIDTEREERRDQQTLRTGQQEGISRTAAIAVAVVGLLGSLLGALAILLNILKPAGT